MSDEPRFIAKTKSIKFDEVATISKNSPPPIPTFNLSELNLLELSRELRASLSSPSSTFIFFRKRENRKLELQREKVNHILGIIDDLRKTNQNLINYQAETFLSQEVLAAVIDNNRIEVKRLVELKEKEHINALAKIDDEIKSRQLLLEAGELVNLKSRAEINMMGAQTQEAKAKAELIMYVVKELDLKNMPQTLQTYLISSIVNPQGSQYQDFDMQEQLKKFVIKEADAKARQATAVASQTEHQTRIAEKTADKTVFDLDTIRNSAKS